jgi:hypothetical protein
VAESRGKSGANSGKRSRGGSGEKGDGNGARGRKLNLPDWVYKRLQLVAIEKEMSASALAAKILAENLPKVRVVEER